MRTYITKPDDIEREWWVVDAEGKTLGRLASEVAKILRGKHKAYYTPNLDCGDFVIVLNADKVRVTGNKLDEKVYYRHSGYPGGLRSLTLREQLQKHPTRAVRLAVWGMLPHNRLGRRMIKKLKIYAEDTHPHQAQQPKPLEI
ncbi:MAG: 50S ribosomal protein L13 [Anaerolineae bacterium]